MEELITKIKLEIENELNNNIPTDNNHQEEKDNQDEKDNQEEKQDETDSRMDVELKYNKILEEFESHIDIKCNQMLKESFDNNLVIKPEIELKLKSELESELKSELEPPKQIFQSVFTTKYLTSALIPNSSPIVPINITNQTINTKSRIAEKMYEDYKTKFFNEEKNYLIIINDSDEKKSFFYKSVKEQIESKYKDGCIVGELKIINFNNIKSDPKIKFKDDVYELHKLYINMPKTDEYVEFETYNYEYIKSKMDEVEELVVLLGASNIETHIYEMTEDSSGINMGINVDIIEKVGVEAGAQNKNSFLTARTKIQKYPDNRVVPNQKSILENKNMHYIFKDNDLKKMLIRRIVSNISHDEYIYLHSKSSEFKNILKLDLSKFGIKFSNEKSITNSFMIKCKIDYFDVPN